MSDYVVMHCDDAREAVSARLDGEPLAVRATDLDAHLAGCGACRGYEHDVSDLHRLVRVRPAEPVPDLTGVIMGRAHRPNRTRATQHGSPWGSVALAPLAWWVQGGLIVVAVALIALAVPALVEPSAGNGHLAAWDLAFAGGLLFAAWQPERSRGLLPMAALLVATMAVATAIDVGHGHPASHGLAPHLLELTGVALLWALAHLQVGARRRGGAAAPAA